MPFINATASPRGLLDSVNDFDVACAPAEVACNRFLDLVSRRLSVLVQKRASRNQHSGRADTAL